MAQSKQAQLDQVIKDMVKHKIGADLAAQATQPVPGAGNPDADIMFVGEAPGKAEDEQGLPFVGAAGRLLNEMLAMIGLKREDVFIGNVVKYRPPNNRDPSPAEVAAFMPYLLRQVAIIRPKLIIPLGRHALSVFLPGLSISVCHGQPKRKSGQVYLPLYHPAVALYNNSMKRTLEEDFMKIPATLKLIEGAKV